MGGVSVSEDVNLRLSQLKGQDEKKVQEEKKVWPARVCAQRARQKIAEWMGRVEPMHLVD